VRTGNLAPLARHELATMLERERDRVLVSMGAFVEASRSPGEAQADRVAALAQEYARLERLAEIEVALERLAEGRYGRCERCAEPMRVEQLYAMPWAWCCGRCAEPGTLTATLLLREARLN
jgi:RNA polymerase-binding transcription factor